MNGFKIFVFMLLSCITATSSLADIYEWTDDNGVKHYSNYAPAAKSKVLMKTKEDPYDEEADLARVEAERQEFLELSRLEIAQREAELELREAEAERKLAAADRMAQEALREADDYLEETGTDSRVIYRGGGWCRDDRYDCNYPIHHRWYYRKKHSRSSRYKASHLSPYPHKRYGKTHYGSNNRGYGHKYRNITSYRHNGNDTKLRLNSRAAKGYGGNRRIGSSSAGLNGRGKISLRSSGFGRRH